MGAHQFVFCVPDDLSDEMVSPVNCATAQVFDDLKRIEVRSGDTVLVQGVGGLGLYAVAMAREAGAQQIIVLDAHPHRLEIAQRFGADRLLNARTTSAKERLAQVLEWTDGLGADVACELTGVPATVSEGATLLCDGERYLWGGNVNRELETIFDPSLVVRKSLSVKGFCAYDPSAIFESLRFLSRTKDRYPFPSILSHHFDFDDINKAFVLADGGEVIRVAIRFPSCVTTHIEPFRPIRNLPYNS